MKIILVAAHDKNNLIGNNNKLPWHLPEDLKHFKDTTRGNTVVMGRKTYESIGFPLPNRRNIILTRNKDLKIDGCDIVADMQDILSNKELADKKLMVIGGTEIYKLFLDVADELVITEVNGEYEGDAYFPEYKEDFKLTEDTGTLTSAKGVEYSIKKYINNV